MKFSENSNNFHELARLARSMSYPARLGGLQCYNYIFRHCKRLVLRLILAHSIKCTLARSKALKTLNTRLKMCISQNHIPILFVCQCTNALMHSRTTCDSSTAQTAFYVSKVKRLHGYFFARLIKVVLCHFFIFWRGLYSFFSSSRRSNIHHIPNSGI